MKELSSYKPVIVLGGGITGLAAALFLKQQNVDFALIEKHPGTSIYPRSRTIDIRTMELFRSLGLSEKLRQRGKHLMPTWGILRGNDLAEAMRIRIGTESPTQYSEVQKHMNAMAEASPETVCRCTQDISEAVMSEEAVSLGLDLRFGHQMISFEQSSERVSLLIEDAATQEQYALSADYLIAADGASSKVRKQLEISTTDYFDGPHLLNIYFEADMEGLVKDNAFSQFLVDTPQMTGFLLTINNKDKWAFHLQYYPERGETVADYSDAKLKGMLNRILGIKGLDITILKVLPWQMTVKVADRMKEGRVFLAGDSAHTMTPYAGKGANSGIQDAQNIAWKLAAVINDRRSVGLLDTYDAERRPVGAFYAELSGDMADSRGLINDSLLPNKIMELMGLPIYTYNAPKDSTIDNMPDLRFNGKPGTRVPHIWLDKGRSISSLDRIRGKWVLVVTTNGRWPEAIKDVFEKLNIRIDLLIIDDAIISQLWKDVTRMDDEHALLIRPDDFVADKVTVESFLEKVATIFCLVHQGVPKL